MQSVIDFPTVSRKIDLATPRDVRREMASVYRDARAGRIPTSDATRLIYCLREISRVLTLERQIEDRRPEGVGTADSGYSMPAVRAMLDAAYAAAMEPTPPVSQAGDRIEPIEVRCPAL